MSYPVKPGDTFVAKAIGTYPELPDWSLDTIDPTFRAIKQWDDLPDGVSHFVTYTGPKGIVVVAYGDGVWTAYRDEFAGEILRQSVWNHATTTWDEVKGVR